MNYFSRIALSVTFCLLIHLLGARTSASAQTVALAQTATQPTTSVKTDNVRYFPFSVNEAALTVKVNIRESKIVQYYTPLFQKYQYTGNVATWEGMIEELMADKDLDFSVRNKINSDSDEDVLVFTASSKEELDYFLKLVQPTFSVISRLESFVKRVDPKQIDDGSHTVEDYR